MKAKIFLILAFIGSFFSYNLRASIDVPNIKYNLNPKNYLVNHPRIIESTLEKVLMLRCSHYLKNNFECKKGIKFFINALDLSFVKPNNEEYIVTFSNDLHTLFQRKDIGLYFKIVESNLEKIMDGRSDLFQLTLNYFKDLNLSIQVMAVMYQDIFETGSPAHILYLEKEFGADEKLLRLNKIINSIGQATQLNNTDNIVSKRILSKRIYHFFVPAYLSLKMKKNNFSNKLSFFLPFIFNYLYEISDMNYSLLYSISEPSSLDSNEKLEDIRMGELGSLLPINSNEYNSFEDFKNKMQFSPQKYIREIIQKIK